MVDYLEMAKQYVQEMLEKRDDIVGAFVVGSVARGDYTEASDIDMGFLVDGLQGDEVQRGGIDTWREGVYIEAGLAPAENYGDVQTVLSDRFTATHMNDALIIYDPKGTWTRVQREVRAAFMEPRYVGARVRPAVEALRGEVAGLAATAAESDRPGVASHVFWISWHLSTVPLLINGITPSSTRGLVLLEPVSPRLRARICRWLGTPALNDRDLKALLPIVDECLSLGGSELLAGMGDLRSYFASKTRWAVSTGQRCLALQGVWGFARALASLARRTDNPRMASGTERVVQDVFHVADWEGQGVLAEKVRTAEEMLAEVEAMAAHLPSDGG